MSLIPSTPVEPENVVAKRLAGDARDAQLRVRLAVAADAVPAFLLRAEVPELGVLVVRDHLCLHPGARDQRLAQLHARGLAGQQPLQDDLRAHVLRQLLPPAEVVLLDAGPFSA